VFIDTPPNMSTIVADAIRAATLAVGPMARRRQQGAAQAGEEAASPGRFAAWMRFLSSNEASRHHL
jgi:hypothetical protein